METGGTSWVPYGGGLEAEEDFLVLSCKGYRESEPLSWPTLPKKGEFFNLKSGHEIQGSCSSYRSEHAREAAEGE